MSCDDATFSLKPVDSWTAIERAVEEHKDQINNLVLINCGASQSLLSLPQNVSFEYFIMMSVNSIIIK